MLSVYQKQIACRVDIIMDFKKKQIPKTAKNNYMSKESNGIEQLKVWVTEQQQVKWNWQTETSTETGYAVIELIFLWKVWIHLFLPVLSSHGW